MLYLKSFSHSPSDSVVPGEIHKRIKIRLFKLIAGSETSEWCHWQSGWGKKSYENYDCEPTLSLKSLPFADIEQYPVDCQAVSCFSGLTTWSRAYAANWLQCQRSRSRDPIDFQWPDARPVNRFVCVNVSRRIIHQSVKIIKKPIPMTPRHGHYNYKKLDIFFVFTIFCYSVSSLWIVNTLFKYWKWKSNEASNEVK